MPRVTVLMSVFNGARYLREAVDSILRQTYREFRFVIVNDGSTDSTGEILGSYSDPRITVISQENRGMAAALNRGLAAAVGEFIARQDHDDVSFPGRLAAQVSFLDANPRVALVGTSAEVVSLDDSAKVVARQVTDPVLLRWILLFGNPFFHTSVMVRRGVLEEMGGYPTSIDLYPAEDYELWSRIASRWEVANLKEILVRYREVPGSMTRNEQRPFRDKVTRIAVRNVRRVLGAECGMDDVRLGRVSGFAAGVWQPDGLWEMWGLVRDLLVLERAFCRCHGLSARESLALRAHNVTRVARRVLRRLGH